jgi:hypothetical protein
MARVTPGPIALPYEFDTSAVWHTILKGAFGLNALLVAGVCYGVLASRWPTALGLAVIELMALAFTRLLLKVQEGSAGVLTSDRVVVEPNALLGVVLPGPSGVYPLDRFSGVRIELRFGPVEPGVQGGPNEVVWLVGKPGTPDVAVARTQDRAGRAIGSELGSLLRLPVEERPQRRGVSRTTGMSRFVPRW